MQTGSWVVFILYSLAVISMGIWSRNLRKKRQMEHKNMEFWMANRELPGWRLGISLTTGWLMLGWIGFGMSQIYAYGATGLWLLQVPWFVLTLMIIILVPFFRRVAALSLPQAVGRRFGANARYLTAIFSLCVFLSWTGAELVVVKTLVAPSLGFSAGSANWALVLFIIPILIYTVMGGFRAIITTDLIQFGIMAIFILVLGGWAFTKANTPELAPNGIINALKEVTPPWAGGKEALNPNFLGWIFPLACLIGYLPGWLIEQDLTLRIQAAPTTRQARKGAILGFVLITVFVITIPALVAFCALIVFNPSGDQAAMVGADYMGIIPAFIQQMPVWLGIFMFLGLVACQMSTVDTFSNVTAMPLAYDLIAPICLRGANKETIAFYARLLTGAAVLLALIYSLIADSLGDVYYISSGVLSASVAVPALAIFWRRATSAGVILGSVMGAAATIIMYFWEYKLGSKEVLPQWLQGGYYYLYIGTGVMASAITLVMVSLITQKPTDAQLSSVEMKPIDTPETIEAVSE